MATAACDVIDDCPNDYSVQGQGYRAILVTSSSARTADVSRRSGSITSRNEALRTHHHHLSYFNYFIVIVIIITIVIIILILGMSLSFPQQERQPQAVVPGTRFRGAQQQSSQGLRGSDDGDVEEAYVTRVPRLQ